MAAASVTMLLGLGATQVTAGYAATFLDPPTELPLRTADIAVATVALDGGTLDARVTPLNGVLEVPVEWDLDTDGNPATGFPVGGIGADIRIAQHPSQPPGLSRWTGSGFEERATSAFISSTPIGWRAVAGEIGVAPAVPTRFVVRSLCAPWPSVCESDIAPNSGSYELLPEGTPANDASSLGVTQPRLRGTPGFNRNVSCAVGAANGTDLPPYSFMKLSYPNGTSYYEGTLSHRVTLADAGARVSCLTFAGTRRGTITSIETTPVRIVFPLRIARFDYTTRRVGRAVEFGSLRIALLEGSKLRATLTAACAPGDSACLAPTRGRTVRRTGEVVDLTRLVAGRRLLPGSKVRILATKAHFSPALVEIRVREGGGVVVAR